MSTEQIANFVLQTKYEDLPEQATRNAKRVILDCVGVTLAGSQEASGEVITGYVKEMGGKAGATVIGGGFRTSAPHAAFANGTMAHALEYDDYDLDTALHPSVCLLPAVLALGEISKISGREVLLSYIVGHEVETKLARALGTQHYNQGWHTTPLVGAMGAAAASAKILKLGQQQVRMALGAAASQTGGMRQNFGSFTKPLHAGHAARSGVIAAQLVQRGFTANENIIEGEFGFVKILGEKGRYDLEKSFDHLGSPLYIVSPGISTKPYPCCGCSHRAVDAMLRLIEEHQEIRPPEIAEVVCEVSDLIPEKIMVYRQPKIPPEAKFSLEYCLAIACLDREVSLRQFTSEKVASSQVQEFMKRVKIVPIHGVKAINEAIDLPQKVTIRLKNGKEYVCQIDVPRGDYRNPMNDEDAAVKFRNCAGLALQEKKIERSLTLLQNLEALPDLSELMKILR